MQENEEKIIDELERQKRVAKDSLRALDKAE